MLAIVAAAVFALAPLLDLVEANFGDALTPQTLMFAGLFLLACTCEESAARRR